jgi:hypothetical protein
MPDKVGVPMPATQLYKRGMDEPEALRDRLCAMYGEATVHNAEHQVVLDMMMLLGVVKPQEFVDVLMRKLERVDRLRREQAGISD